MGIVKHLRRLSVQRADVFTDFLNDLFLDWRERYLAKKGQAA